MVFFNNELNDKIVGGLLADVFNSSKNTLEFDNFWHMEPGISMTEVVGLTSLNNVFENKGGTASTTGLPELYRGGFYGISSNESMLTQEQYKENVIAGTISKSVKSCGFIRVVSDKYINTLNKVYKMIWAEEITEAKLIDGKKAFYTQPDRIKALVNIIYHDGKRPQFTDEQNESVKFSYFVDKLIANGDLTEADKLDEYDSINLTEFDKTNCAVNIDSQARKVKLIISKPQILDRLMDSTQAGKGQGKKYHIMLNPVLPTSNKICKNGHYFYHTYYRYHYFYPIDKNAFGTSNGIENNDIVFNAETKAHANFPEYNRAPWASFKGNPSNEFYKDTIIMGSHVFFSIGTRAEYDLAPADSKPDIVFDHTDKISAIDKLEINLDLEDLILDSN